jgi:uncharacterized lipoprotein YmbA
MLQTAQETPVSKKIGLASSLLVGVGPVKVPEYLERPQIVTRSKENTLKFAQFDRWGESLGLGLTRLIREDLVIILPGVKFIAHPWESSVTVKYQVIVEIIQLDSTLNKNMFLVAQWQVVDAQNMKTILIKRSEFRQPIIPQDYPGLVKTLSTVCASLSNEIAEALAWLEIPHS